MKKLKYLSLGLFGLLAFAGVAYATVFYPFQGGTGTGTNPAKGSVLIGASSTAYAPLAVGSDGKVLTASSSATNGVSWETSSAGITSLNGSTSSTQTFATSGAPILNISTANGVHTFNLSASSTWGFQPIFTTVPFASTTGVQNTISFPIPVASTSLAVVPNLTLVTNLLNTIQDIQTTSSPTFATGTFTGNVSVGNHLFLTSSSVPTPTSINSIIIHAHNNQGILEPHAHSVWTTNGCDDLVGDNCAVAKNTSGGNLTIGQVVYVNGGNPSFPSVGLAKADATSTASALALVTSSSVANNGFVYIMRMGLLDNVNTAAFNVDDPLYLSCTTAGALTNSRPLPPCLVERIGTVLASNANNGAIAVDVAPAVLGQETGTISPTFNINGQNALTSSTGVVAITAGTNITISSSSGNVTINSTGGSGTPGGSSTQVQYNEAGSFAATSTFTYTTTTKQLALSDASSSMRIGSSSQAQSFGNKTYITVLFSKTGASTTWTVPMNVSSITITAIGAGAATSTSGGGTLGAATVGGVATGTLAVVPGQVYYINVGGHGVQGSGGNPVAGGYNGGGGGAGSQDPNRSAVGGGGCTFFGKNASFTQSSLILVGAGGGGPGTDFNAQAGAGGNAGGLTGSNGTDGANNAGSGGTGGTQSAGGTSGGNQPGTSGTFGQGGTASSTPTPTGAGGGGGCGYFGGGAGGGGTVNLHAGGGGGGGSSFATSTNMSATSTAADSIAAQDGSLYITYTVSGGKSYALAVDDDIVTGGNMPSVTSCGIGTLSANSNDTNGNILLDPSKTSCVLQFSHVSNNPVWCQAIEVGVTTSTPYISAQTSSTVTFGFTAATGGSMNYLCLRN